MGLDSTFKAFVSIPPKPIYSDIEARYRQLLTSFNFAKNIQAEINNPMSATYLLASGLKRALDRNGSAAVEINREKLEMMTESVEKQKIILEREFNPAYMLEELQRVNEEEDLFKENHPDYQQHVTDDYTPLLRHLAATYEIIGAIDDTVNFEREIIDAITQKFTESGTEQAELTADTIESFYNTTEQQKNLTDILTTLVTKRELVYKPRPVNVREVLDKSLGIVEYKAKKEGHNIVRQYKDKPSNIYFIGDITRAITVPIILVNNALKAFHSSGKKTGHVYADYDPFDRNAISITFLNDGPPMDSDVLNLTPDILNDPWRKVRGEGLITCVDIIENRFKGIFAYENTPTGVKFEMQVPRSQDLM